MKCPGCGAFINPAWDTCHACGFALKGAAFLETVKPDTPHPAREADFECIASRHWNRVGRLVPHRVYEMLAESWPTLHNRIIEADAEITRLWLSCSRGERQYPDTFPAFNAAFRKWARLNLQGARYVRLLDKGIRRIYSRKVDGWIYLVRDKAAVRGVRLRPRGAVYTQSECAALLTMNPGADELRTLHRAKTMFEAELSVSVKNF